MCLTQNYVVTVSPLFNDRWLVQIDFGDVDSGNYSGYDAKEFNTTTVAERWIGWRIMKHAQAAQAMRETG